MEELLRWELMRTQLRKRRLDLGLTQTQVSEMMGRSQDFVSVLENNPRSIPNLTTLWLWCDALNVPLILDLTKEAPSERQQS